VFFVDPSPSPPLPTPRPPVPHAQKKREKRVGGGGGGGGLLRMQPEPVWKSSMLPPPPPYTHIHTSITPPHPNAHAAMHPTHAHMPSIPTSLHPTNVLQMYCKVAALPCALFPLPMTAKVFFRVACDPRLRLVDWFCGFGNMIFNPDLTAC